MASSSGNAVTARWVGPSGQQLFDGTTLGVGDLVDGVGKDEAEQSAYWEVVSSPKKSDTTVSDVSANRNDWSFASEEGGAGTGRPEATDESAPAAPVADPTPASVIPDVLTPAIGPDPIEASDGGSN